MTDDNGSAAEKTPVDQAMDVLVYAPIGLLFEGATILPQLVDKGRSQVTMARMVGKFAVQQGRTEAMKTASKLGDQAAGLLDFLGGTLTPVTADEPPPAPAPLKPKSSGRAAAAAKTTPGTTAPPATASTKARTAPAGGKASAVSAVPDVADVATLAIPDYDGLSASHVVNRLGGLDADELEAVRTYEAANRGRKTILSKIAQLQSA